MFYSLAEPGYIPGSCSEETKNAAPIEDGRLLRIFASSARTKHQVPKLSWQCLAHCCTWALTGSANVIAEKCLRGALEVP